MQLSTPSVNLLNTGKSVLSQNHLPYTVLAWIPYSMVYSEDVRQNIDQLIGKYLKDKDHSYSEYLLKIGEAWKKRICQQYPTSMNGTLILTANEEKIGLIPTKYYCTRSEIHDQINGWGKLIQCIQNEPKYNIIQLSVEFAELHEIKQGNSTLLIRQPINRHNRLGYMRAFAYSVRQICNKESGPLIVRCTANGIHELDTITISKVNSIHRYMINRNNSAIAEWSREMSKCGLSEEWIQSWLESRITQAMKENKWAVNEQQIKTYLLQNRIDLFVKNESTSDLFKNNYECNSLLFKNNVRIIKSDLIKSGAIIN